jgi:hypothetical protein
MNWGYKIAILYIGFVLLILTLVGMSSRQKVDLVSADYYEKELKFQDRLDDLNRSNELSEPLVWSVQAGSILLNFPNEFKGRKTSGSIYFFRPSDSGMDKTLVIPADTNLVRNISTNILNSGLYKMEISWESEGQKYYNEGIIQIK